MSKVISFFKNIVKKYFSLKFEDKENRMTYVPKILHHKTFQSANQIYAQMVQENHEKNNMFGALFLYQFKRCPFSGKVKANFLQIKIQPKSTR